MEDKNDFNKLWKEYIKIIAPEYKELEKKRIDGQKTFY